MIKIVNRRVEGSLYHYAHFICDCLFPEIINQIYKYPEVVREKNLVQTLGNFTSIYEDVMQNKSIEMNQVEYNVLNVNSITYNNKEVYQNKSYFDTFRNFIFNRYNINPEIFDTNYPEVILIKRGGRKELIDDIELQKINKNIMTGKERREIDQVDKVDEYLENKYTSKFKSLYLENLTFEEQVKYFNNAKLIICAHGAGMSNLFFCKKHTKVIEVVCNKYWTFFDTITRINSIFHIKCNINKYENIIQLIDINEIKIEKQNKNEKE